MEKPDCQWTGAADGYQLVVEGAMVRYSSRPTVAVEASAVNAKYR